MTFPSTASSEVHHLDDLLNSSSPPSQKGLHTTVLDLCSQLLLQNSPLLVVNGSSFSPLVSIYKNLPHIIHHAITESNPTSSNYRHHKVHLVPHLLSNKGYHHCASSPGRYTVAYSPPRAETFDTIKRNTRVHWLVPFFLRDTNDLKSLYASWMPALNTGERCQYILFVNTDLPGVTFPLPLTTDTEELSSKIATLSHVRIPPDTLPHPTPPLGKIPLKHVPVLTLHGTDYPFTKWVSGNEEDVLVPSKNVRLTYNSMHSGMALLTGGKEEYPRPILCDTNQEPENALYHQMCQKAVALTVAQTRQLPQTDWTPFLRLSPRDTHQYAPVVSEVSSILTHDACLSDVFVLEFSFPFSGKGNQVFCWKQSFVLSSSERMELKAVDDYVLSLSRKYHFVPQKSVASELLNAVQRLAKGICSTRNVYSWSVTDFESDGILRLALTISYEHRDREQLMDRMANTPRLTCSNMEDVTTMEYTLVHLLDALRRRGWFLIRQEDHTAWDKKRKLKSHEEESFLSLTMAIKEMRNERIAIPSVGPNDEEEPLETPVLTGKENRRNSSAVWRACCIDETDCVHLTKGQHILLENGRFARIVDFLPPPDNITELDGRARGFQLYCPVGKEEKEEYFEPFLSWWRLERSRIHKTACLPVFFDRVEVSLFPLVQLLHSNKMLLLLPTSRVQYQLRYPTVCFVSVGEQFRRQVEEEEREGMIQWTDEREAKRWMEKRYEETSGDYQPALWQLQPSSSSAWVKCLQLPIQRSPFVPVPNCYLSSLFPSNSSPTHKLATPWEKLHQHPSVSPLEYRRELARWWAGSRLRGTSLALPPNHRDLVNLSTPAVKTYSAFYRLVLSISRLSRIVSGKQLQRKDFFR